MKWHRINVKIRRSTRREFNYTYDRYWLKTRQTLTRQTLWICKGYSQNKREITKNYSQLIKNVTDKTNTKIMLRKKSYFVNNGQV